MYSDVSKNDARPPVTATPPLRNPERDPPASTPPPPRPENRAQIRYFSPVGKLQKKGINYIYTPVHCPVESSALDGESLQLSAFDRAAHGRRAHTTSPVRRSQSKHAARRRPRGTPGAWQRPVGAGRSSRVHAGQAARAGGVRAGGGQGVRRALSDGRCAPAAAALVTCRC